MGLERGKENSKATHKTIKEFYAEINNTQETLHIERPNITKGFFESADEFSKKVVDSVMEQAEILHRENRQLQLQNNLHQERITHLENSLDNLNQRTKPYLQASENLMGNDLKEFNDFLPKLRTQILNERWEREREQKRIQQEQAQRLAQERAEQARQAENERIMREKRERFFAEQEQRKLQRQQEQQNNKKSSLSTPLETQKSPILEQNKNLSDNPTSNTLKNTPRNAVETRKNENGTNLPPTQQNANLEHSDAIWENFYNSLSERQQKTIDYCFLAVKNEYKTAKAQNVVINEMKNRLLVNPNIIENLPEPPNLATEQTKDKGR